MTGGGVPPPWWVLPDRGLRDLRALRLGAVCGVLGFAGMDAILLYLALGGGNYAVGLILAFIGLPVAAVCGAVGIALGVGAGIRHTRPGTGAGLTFPIAGLALAFAGPGVVIMSFGRAPVPSWWATYLVLLPLALLAGAHLALLEPASAARGDRFRPLRLLVPAIVGSAGPLGWMLVVTRSVVFEWPGVALSILGFACDMALVAWAAREGRQRAAYPVVWSALAAEADSGR